MTNLDSEALATVPGTPASPTLGSVPSAPKPKEAPGLAPVQAPTGGLTEVAPPSPEAVSAGPAPVNQAPEPSLAPPPSPTLQAPASPTTSVFGEAVPNARIDNPFQQKVMAARQAGYSWDEINQYVAKSVETARQSGYTDAEISGYMGLAPSDLPALAKGISANVADDALSPPMTSDPWGTFTDTLINYSGLGELAHVKVPEAPKEAADFWSQLAQTGAIVLGSVPQTVVGARIGAAGGSFFGPWGTTIGGLGGAAVGLYLDAFVRDTYADAIKNGETGNAPNFADHAVEHATDALKETVPAVAAMAVGGPAEFVVAPYVSSWVARFGARPVAELATMAVASGVVNGKLPTWEEMIDNAIILAAAHGSVALGTAGKSALSAAADKLDQMTVNQAAKALVDNWSVTNEGPADATARVTAETSADGLTQRATDAGAYKLPPGGKWKPGFGPDAVRSEFVASGVDGEAPAVRARWWNAASASGTKVANDILSKSAGDADRFNELYGAYVMKDFQADPAKYGGDLDGFLTGLDSKAPISPEMQKAAQQRMEDKAGKPVPPTVRLQATKASMSGILQGVTKTIRTIFNPENMDVHSREAVALIRANTGYAARATEQAGAAVGAKERRVVNKVDDIAPIINYIEGKDSGAMMPVSHGETQKAADTIKAIVDSRRTAIKNSGIKAEGIVDEYWTHLWSDTAKARELLKGKTSWPTVGEGIRAGLEPRTDPISAVMEYAAGMDRALAMHGIRETAMEAGDWQYYKRGEQPEGWVELKGPHAERVQSFEGADGKPASKVTHAFAPEGFARVYNNFVSKGIGDIAKEYADVYDYAQRTSNAISGLKLALSGYHAITVTLRSFSNGMAQGIDELTSGHPIMALKTFGTFPARPFWSVYRGRNAQRMYQGKINGTDQDQRIIDLITEAGGRMAGNKHAIDVQYSQVGSYITSLIRGSLGAELKADVAQTFSSPAGFVPVIARNVGRVLETIGQPLFQKYIPWLKNAATMANVSSWLERNPAASHADALKATRYIVDQMDNRFGEMVHENIFANKFAKQMGSIAFLSWSWTVGEDIRAMGGGAVDSAKFVRDISKFEKPTWTPKMSYLIAEPLVTAMAGAIYQYLKTGSWPESPLDFFAPKTGGTVKGIPERAQVPGVMKDVFAFYDHPTEEVWNKASPFAHTVAELWNNKDWKDDPIAPINVPGYDMFDVMKAFAGYIASNTLTPISMTNSADNPKTSNFSPIENLFGFRQPTPLLRDPEGHAQSTRYFAQQEWRDKLRSDARAAQNRSQEP